MTNPNTLALLQERTWRSHWCALWLIAISYDLVLRDEVGPDDCLVDLLKHPFVSRVDLLCQLVSDESLLFHPRYSGRDDITLCAYHLLKDVHASSPMLAASLAAYFFSGEEIHKRLLYRAYTICPYSTFLHEEIRRFCDINITDFYGLPHQPSAASATTVVFTPCNQVEIGRLHSLIDIVRYYLCTEPTTPKRFIMISSAHSHGESLCQIVRSKLNVDIEWLHWSNLYTANVCELATYLLHLNPHILNFTLRERIIFEQTLDQANNDIVHRNRCHYAAVATKHVALHLRTNRYKYTDDQDLSQAIRSVSPHTYREAVAYLNNSGYAVIQITADNDPLIVPGAQCCLVKTSADQIASYNILADAEFIIGTQSGISGFSGLNNYRCLFTNFTGLVPELPLSKHQIFAFQRLKPMPEAKNIHHSKIITLLLGPWFKGGKDCLLNYTKMSPLDSTDILSAVKQYLHILAGNTTSCSLRSVLAPYFAPRNSILIPNVSITTETRSDIIAVLDHCKFD